MSLAVSRARSQLSPSQQYEALANVSQRFSPLLWLVTTRLNQFLRGYTCLLSDNFVFVTNGLLWISFVVTIRAST